MFVIHFGTSYVTNIGFTSLRGWHGNCLYNIRCLIYFNLYLNKWAETKCQRLKGDALDSLDVKQNLLTNHLSVAQIHVRLF